VSERTVATKLLIKSGDSLSLIGAGADETRLLRPLPDNVTVISDVTVVSDVTVISDVHESTDVAVIFARSQSDLLQQSEKILGTLTGTRAVWFCYPKGGRADLNRDTLIREMGGFGWRAISNVAVDDTWSAVRVRPLKPGEAPIG
jgi:hypothetical protein